MFENSAGEVGGSISRVDAIHMGDGCFSGYPARALVIDHCRCGWNHCTGWGGRPVPKSGGRMWAAGNEHGAQSRGITVSRNQYWLPCAPNLSPYWQQSPDSFRHVDISEVEFTPRQPLVLSLCGEQAPPSPPLPPSLPPLPPANLVLHLAGGVGEWGGTCTCPDGRVYSVGDNLDLCASLACAGGESGACHQSAGPWSYRSVECAPYEVSPPITPQALIQEAPSSLPLPRLSLDMPRPSPDMLRPLPPDMPGPPSADIPIFSLDMPRLSPDMPRQVTNVEAPLETFWPPPMRPSAPPTALPTLAPQQTRLRLLTPPQPPAPISQQKTVSIPHLDQRLPESEGNTVAHTIAVIGSDMRATVGIFMIGIALVAFKCRLWPQDHRNQRLPASESEMEVTHASFPLRSALPPCRFCRRVTIGTCLLGIALTAGFAFSGKLWRQGHGIQRLPALEGDTVMHTMTVLVRDMRWRAALVVCLIGIALVAGLAFSGKLCPQEHHIQRLSGSEGSTCMVVHTRPQPTHPYPTLTPEHVICTTNTMQGDSEPHHIAQELTNGLYIASVIDPVPAILQRSKTQTQELKGSA